MPTTEQLKELQSKTLEEKIQISSARIMEWYERWNGQVYVSFSGGKDSVVLLHLVRRLYPDVLGVYMDTGLEYPELREFVKKFDNIQWLQPQKYDRKTRSYKRYTFTEVLKDYGYPIISKEQAAFISEYRTTKSEKLKDIRFNGNKYGKGLNKGISSGIYTSWCKGGFLSRTKFIRKDFYKCKTCGYDWESNAYEVSK